MADALLRRLALDDGMELWVAEADGLVVSAGRLEPVPGTDFAGIWGGSTLKEWRGRGIYRALTAARARSALRMGKTLIHSDSTEYSRPILEKVRLPQGLHHNAVPLAWLTATRSEVRPPAASAGEQRARRVTPARSTQSVRQTSSNRSRTTSTSRHDGHPRQTPSAVCILDGF